MALRDELKTRCNRIEESYEFLLAFAAQGLPATTGNQNGGQARDFLTRADEALAGIGDLFGRLAEQEQFEPRNHYCAFIEVLDRDARDAQAAVRLVLAQPALSSQLVDNLNASIHLRALLTDLFLIDEILKIAS